MTADQPELITGEQTAHLDKLFDAWEGVTIQTDEDLTALADDFDEDEWFMVIKKYFVASKKGRFSIR